MGIFEEYKIDLETETESKLRNIINSWSNAIPYHSHQDFGKKIKIKEINYAPIYALHITSQFFSQHDVKRERSYGSGLSYPNGSNTVRKKYLRSGLVRHSDIYCIPGSESIHTCSGCHGTGKNDCRPCSGNGRVSCHGCSGTGNCRQCSGNGRTRCYRCNGGSIPCSSCGGRGSSWHYDYNSKQQVSTSCYSCGGSGSQRCPNCRGTAYTNCMTCFGSGRCSTCNGNRTLVCGSCKGTGQVLCAKCEGYGKIIVYTERHEIWDLGNVADFVVPEILRTKFKTLLIKPENVRNLILEEYAEKLHTDFFNEESDYFQLIYGDLYKKSLNPSGLNVQSDASLLEQVIKVSKIPVYEIEYSYEDATHQLLVFSNDQAVFEEEGPITTFRTTLITHSAYFLKRRNFGKSADLAYKAIEMGLDIKDPLLERINKKVKLKISQSYQIGAYFGTWITSYLVALYLLSAFKKPFYILPVLNEFADNWGSGFMLAGNGLTILLVLLISIIGSIKAARSLNAFIGIKAKPEIIRFAFGFLTSIAITLFAAVTMVLIKSSGILLPLDRAIQLIIDIFLDFRF